MTIRILKGDCRDVLATLPDASVHCVVTSPPYFGLRNYGVEGQIGLERSPADFVDAMVAVFGDVRRVLREDGTLWLNLGDSYATCGTRQGNSQGGLGPARNDEHRARAYRPLMEGLKNKDLIGIPWRVAFALQSDGWWLRDAIVWAKPNGMPGSQQDRCTSSYEMIFQFSKSARYWSDFDAIKTPPRESSLVRTAQDLQAQAGSHRANGGAKTNGPMKAVGVRQSDKQRGHSRVHAGFNDRWDAMDRAEQQSKPATMRNVWFVAPAQFEEAHYAVMPDEIARRCILAGCPENGTVLDPFLGAGTTALAADRLGRDCVGIELNPDNAAMAERRLNREGGLFASVEVTA